MAINCYTGLQGSGKSFEVVSSVIVPAVLQGRRVVTNIDGINPEAIEKYLVETKNADPAKLGKIIAVKNEDVIKPGFFPDEDQEGFVSVVQGGDLVAIDEVWQFWSPEHKISFEQMKFFRMHRHYAHPETFVTCDIALMVQEYGSLHRKLKSVVEMTSRTTKLKSIGTPTAYRIELFEGSKTTKSSRLDVFVKKYNKAIFPLYKSYSGGTGSEKAMDKRQNILTNPRIWVTAVFFAVLMGFGFWNTWKFFHPAPKVEPGAPVMAGAGAAGAAAAAPGAIAAPGQPPRPAVLPPPSDAFSDSLRIVGRYSGQGESWVVMASANGLIRVESPSMFTGKGIYSLGIVDGRKVTTYSGTPAPSMFQPPKDSK